MKIPAGTDGCGEERAGSIEGLVDAHLIATSRDFFYEQWREPLFTQLAVNDQEVDLTRFQSMRANSENCRSPGDESN